MPNPLSGEQVIARIRERTDTILLGFSRGKDSICTWLECRKHFRVIPFYLYRIPGVSFVDESLAYYERFFGCHIYRIPHPATYRQLREMVFQPPERCRIIESFDLPQYTYEDAQGMLREHLGLGDEVFCAMGVRAADSAQRRIAINRYGAINEKRLQFFPVWDWDKERLLSAIVGAGVKLPVDYRLFGRSFDGIDYRFLEPIRRYFPRDYERILRWFPLAELEILRRDYAAQTEVA